MRVMGIETSTSVISVAVAEDSKVLGEFSLTAKQGHMKNLLPLIDQLLSGLEIGVGDLDGFAVSVGPGSFTSLRVGLTTCKALAHTVKKPVVDIPTLDVLAWGLQGVPGLICPVITARRDEVYAALYVSSEQGIKRLSSYLALSPIGLAERLGSELRGKIIFTGEGAEANWPSFYECLGDNASLAGPVRMWPRAGQTAVLGVKILSEEGGKEPGAVQALYVKPPAIRRQS
ncbi:MAG: tRNA (adenosine(37)-N6)-threonylcarbamoyltransferase complex dimerization subunit type 1 TsaB [Syntrophaceticus sp.]|nr:tRNA (adenosine(37)-N6)-threonylcarbamoyltransferase complex dimerization subunit type 1 TsaB [Syntrophaceticus sp.]MDD3315698.1 tRNA (adenosine(37)-N6)-threonylcarbamoyltransferase complex dimerization subunit type 1 TsaB [Syntrophaceticus sp.]MDD4360076.1 tRNA (adenosine(37)-N6)-threonylcarbamoyltransferase complex dimerization subunit type 1 TsaB [Syntrophaceticus sp.]MDD4783335.1 tRNA (adenosine(37)-N6)-threonylcarbamoyltransferase complex dimerization subunit type 1 TsaB [Syntrophaceticu